MADETIPQTEAFSIGKFFGGIFNSVNTAKAAMTTLHQLLIVIAVIGAWWIGSSIYGHFHKAKSTPPVPPIAVTTNTGHISTSSDDRRKNCWLLNFCW